MVTIKEENGYVSEVKVSNHTAFKVKKRPCSSVNIKPTYDSIVSEWERVESMSRNFDEEQNMVAYMLLCGPNHDNWKWYNSASIYEHVADVVYIVSNRNYKLFDSWSTLGDFVKAKILDDLSDVEYIDNLVFLTISEDLGMTVHNAVCEHANIYTDDEYHSKIICVGMK